MTKLGVVANRVDTDQTVSAGAISHRIGGNRKTLLTIDERQSKIPRNSFRQIVIAICRQSDDKWQSKTLFLTIFIYVGR